MAADIPVLVGMKGSDRQKIRNVREQVAYLETFGGGPERDSEEQKQAAEEWSDRAVRS